jgi:hypothetical protein
VVNYFIPVVLTLLTPATHVSQKRMNNGLDLISVNLAIALCMGRWWDEIACVYGDVKGIMLKPYLGEINESHAVFEMIHSDVQNFYLLISLT